MGTELNVDINWVRFLDEDLELFYPDATPEDLGFSDTGKGQITVVADFYVGKTIYEKLKKGKEVKDEEAMGLLMELVSPDCIPDDEIMLPVDMNAVGPWTCVKQMIEDLGEKETLEAFVKAREPFEKNPDGSIMVLAYQWLGPQNGSRRTQIKKMM